MSQEDLLKILPRRKVDSHKGDYGHILVLAGSVGMTGAACLVSQAALLAGSGLVTLGIPKSLNPIVEIKLTEVITKPLAETKNQSLSLKAYPEIMKLTEKTDTVVIGPGLSKNRETVSLIKRLIVSIKLPIVLDADGINAIAENIEILKRIKSTLTLTPHACEMARLKGTNVKKVQSDRKEVAIRFANNHKVIIVLKGYKTIVAGSEGEIYVNRTGNPGMATAGSGDVLAGIIGSFIGQGISPFRASKLAVYLHGLSGDIAAKEKGQVSLIASDILNKLPEAIKTIYPVRESRRF